MLWELIFIFFIILVGSFIQGSTGFGMGLFTMGFLPLFLPLKDSSLLVIFLLSILSLSIIIKLYKYVEFKKFWLILIVAFCGRIVSYFFLTSFGEMDILKKGLGFFLIGLLVYILFLNKKEAARKLMLHPLAPIILGFIGGFTGGVFAVGGPFFVFYFLMLYKEKHSYNANLQVTFFLTNIFTLILHTGNGDISTIHYLYFLTGTLSTIIGVELGLKLFEKLPRERIQKSATFVVLIAALNLIIFS